MTSAEEALLHLQNVLEVERRYQAGEFERLLGERSIKERISNGITWYPLRLISSGYAVGTTPFIIVEQTKPNEDKDKFQAGRPVRIYTNHADEEPVKGIIHWINKLQMKLYLNSRYIPDWLTSGKLVVDLLYDEQTFIEMKEVIQAVMAANDNTPAGRLRRYFYDDQYMPVQSAKTLQLQCFNEGLNDSQKAAVAQAIGAEDIACIHGPPGTGKTLLAKAVAGQAQVPFFSLSGSDFVEMFVGVGASRVRDLFKQAKEKAPCIVFIDEIDAVGRARGKNPVTGSNDERENTLNQLLAEMDGFGTNIGVIILAATNRADVLDRALMRAGRFDRQIHVEMPDLTEREAIFKVHMKPLKLEKGLEAGFLAKQTPGFSGADIANVCNEAALIAARRNNVAVAKQDFLDAVDRIIGGLEKRNKIISPSEKKVIAYHESGHAAVSWLLEHAHPLVKVTIVPRGKALGAAWYLPEERQISTYEQMFDEITSTLGGRAAEEIIFGKISTGALNDLEKITKQAYAMVIYFGLNKKIGNISYYDSSGQNEYTFTKPYSEKTAQKIDEEVSRLVEKAYERAKGILLEHREKLVQLGDLLLEKEVIFREDLERIFGERPFPDPETSKEKELEVGSTASKKEGREKTNNPT